MSKTPPRTSPVSPERAMSWALAAAAGLSLAACQQSSDQKGDEAKSEKAVTGESSADKNCCHGKNECKGKGGCAVPGKNGCAGKNECKGQGGCNMHCPK